MDIRKLIFITVQRHISMAIKSYNLHAVDFYSYGDFSVQYIIKILNSNQLQGNLQQMQAKRKKSISV